MKNLPSQCPCGAAFNVTHAMNCTRGGFVVARHNNIRDFECNMLKIVAQDVECEPGLQPVSNRVGYHRTANLRDDARLDIQAK